MKLLLLLSPVAHFFLLPDFSPQGNHLREKKKVRVRMPVEFKDLSPSLKNALCLATILQSHFFITSMIFCISYFLLRFPGHLVIHVIIDQMNNFFLLNKQYTFIKVCKCTENYFMQIPYLVTARKLPIVFMEKIVSSRGH